MALKAGYYGLKRELIEFIKSMQGAKVIKSVSNGLSLSDNGELSADIDTATMEFKNGKLAAKNAGWDYSTDEVDTGQKWIDGRPIYCKVIALDNTISTTAGSWASTGESSTGVDVLLNISSAGDACTNLRGANKVGSTEEFHIQAYYGTVSVSTVIVYYLKAAPAEVTSTRSTKKSTK